ncbi:S41 family peptidase [Treponema sp. OMZ 788]|uniref:S41 family peptidase n=1 Tax=unclassified Treponema TaxID=2638727 RepID=UPI0020A5142D|nr:MULTISPECIES: S41 family peptidase [unclassified Treponema]UTC61281.1 S41 family peptidase [Treponema sp. OMZ 787]UTC63648.1 S41 family peptidase [Treponema sp. OMZ 788]
MNKRITWINTIIFLTLLLAAVFFMPQKAPATSNSASDPEAADTNLKYLESVYKLLQENYVDEIDPAVLYKGAMEGMLNSLEDPYTSYIFKDTTVGHDLEDTTTGVFCGIGVHITKSNISTPERPAYVEIASPIEGTPGWRAGLQPGDYIIEIDGVKTEDITQEDVLNMLRGKEGTQVTIKILRGKNLTFDLTITRALIEVPTIKYTKIGKDIAYIRLIEFNPNSAKRITEAIENLQAEGCTKLILDLKNNPGGLISSSIDVASIFLDSGLVVSTKGRARGTSEAYKVRRFVQKVPKNMPIVVLINEGSASASEIVSGALKDHKRAYLVGTRSYGKGLVQSVVQLSEKELVKLTIARYYSPSGANIDKLGILPDLEVIRPNFTPEEEKSVLELLKTSKIADFTRSKTSLKKTEMIDFAKKLGEEYNVRHELILRLVKVEYYRSHESPVIDEDDEQLKAAVNLLTTKDVNALCKTTKTLFEMQEEEKAKAENKAITEDKN